MPGSFKAALRDFLVSQFELDGLRLLVGELPGGGRLKAHLTYPTSLFIMSDDVARLSVEQDQLADLRLALHELRPHYAAVLDEIWALPRPQPEAPVVAKKLNPSPSVPDPPDGLEDRPEYQFIKAGLLSQRKLVGITGLPGSGKTTAAIAALDKSVRARFAAVCWVDPDPEHPLERADVRRSVARQLGGSGGQELSREDLAGLAAEVVGDGNLLVVLDEPRGRLDQLVDAARCHPRTTVLITLSDSSALLSLRVHEPVALAGLPAEAALRLLARWSNVEPDALPQAAADLAEAIGFHAEGLRILAAIVSAATDPAAEWSYLAQQLRAHAISRQPVPGISDSSLAALLDRALDSTPDQLRPIADALAVVPSGTVIDFDTIAGLSGVPQEECRRLADALVRRSMAFGWTGKYGLRPLAHLCVRERPGFDARYRELMERLQPAQPALVSSIVLRDTPMALRLVQGSSVDALGESTPERGSPLHQAAFHGLGELVDAIVEKGVDPSTLDRSGALALHYAAHAGQTNVARLLRRRGLSPLQKNDGGKDALFVALHHDQITTAEALLEGVEGPAPGDAALALDLQKAIQRQAPAVARLLVELGAPHDPDLGPGNTPLLPYAMGEGQLEVAALLLDRGGKDFRADTLSEALMFAAQEGQMALLERLIALGADRRWTNDAGRTALAQAAAVGQADAVRVLAGAGASVESLDGAGWAPVHLAAAFHQASVIEALRQAGADLDREGPGGERALGISVLRAGPGAEMETTSSLDERGSHFSSVVVVTDVDPRVVRTVGALLSGEATVDAANTEGRTALHHAVTVVQPALASALVSYGARRDFRDRQGQTPMDLLRKSAAASAAALFRMRIEALQKLMTE